MTYEARPGVDYLVDYYRAAGVAPDATPEDVNSALNARLREYHPDRLGDLAPEFQEKGEHMTRLLTTAKGLLLDPAMRAEYDALLASWDGPISTDGTPVIKMKDFIRAETAQLSSKALEERFDIIRGEIRQLTGHNQKQQDLFERLFTAAPADSRETLRDAYDEALLKEDRTLAIEASQRSDLLGIETTSFDVTIGYEAATRTQIEAARAEIIETQQRRTIGSKGLRLALLSGQVAADTEETPTTEVSAEVGVPPYFETQAEKVQNFAAAREAILQKRLGIFEPSYPIAEQQTEAQTATVIGVEIGRNTQWLGFEFDVENVDFNGVELSETIATALEAEDYAQVYGEGYNILRITPKENIHINALIEEALRKYILKFYPELV